MAAKTLRASVRYPAEGAAEGAARAAVIDLQGEINSQAESELNSAYDQAAGSGAHDIVLNFGGVDYINSTGIALIVGLLSRARLAGRRLLAYGLSEHYVEIFKITRLMDFLSVYPDETSALHPSVSV